MNSYLGEVYCLSQKEKRYIVLVGEDKTRNNHRYYLVNLIYAKPFEVDSDVCIGKLKIIGEQNKDSTKKQIFRVIGMPYYTTKITSYGKTIGKLNDVQLNKLVALLDNQEFYKHELLRLKEEKDRLHKRLSELKTLKLCSSINCINYSAIEKEKDELARNLGYIITNQTVRNNGYRFAPSKYIKVCSGGRGG